MPEIIIIAGPNGAGKTSFANQFLVAPGERQPFVNADEIARQMISPSLSNAQRDIRAAREMLRRIDVLVEGRMSFTLETTLASLTYAKKVQGWRKLGFHVVLIYLRLPSAEASIERVRKRMEAGGHGLPDNVIRKRYSKSLKYLDKLFKPAVDEWYIWDSLEGEFRLAQSWDER